MDKVEQLLIALEVNFEDQPQLEIIRQLVETGDPRILKPLSKHFSQSDIWAQKLIIGVLETVGHYRAISFLGSIQKVASKSSRHRIETALHDIKAELRSIKRKEARNPVSGLTIKPVSGLTINPVSRLTMTNDQSANDQLVDHLAKGLYNWRRRVKPSVVQELAKTNDISAVPHLIDALLLGGKSARLSAIKGLVDIAAQNTRASARTEVVKNLIPLVDDKDRGVNNAAKAGLLKLCEGNLKPLTNQLKFMEPLLRQKVLRVLTKLDGSAAVPYWIEDLCSSSHKIAFQSAKQLIKIGLTVGPDTGFVKPDTEPILKLLKADKIIHRKCALQVLSKSRKRSVLNYFFKLLDSHEPEIQDLAVEVLVAGKQKTVKLLPAALKDEDPMVRAGAARILGNFSPVSGQTTNPESGSLEQLALLMKDSQPGVRLQAIIALAGFVNEQTFQLLSHALTDADKDVRLEAVKGLDLLMVPQTFEPLLRALKDEDKPVRIAAAKALGNLGDKRAADPLAQYLYHDNTGKEDETVYMFKQLNTFDEAVFALAQLNDTRAVEPLIRMTKRNVKSAGTRLHSLVNASPKEDKDFFCEKCYCRFEQKRDRTLSIAQLKDQDRVNGQPGHLVIEYYACRKCQSNLYCIEGISTMVLVMDHGFPEPLQNQDGIIKINWYKREEPFDFDEIRIDDANDYDVEKLVMKLNNDMDQERRENLAQVPVYLSPRLKLSTAKLNLLKDTFRFVKTEEDNG